MSQQLSRSRFVNYHKHHHCRSPGTKEMVCPCTAATSATAFKHLHRLLVPICAAQPAPSRLWTLRLMGGYWNRCDISLCARVILWHDHKKWNGRAHLTDGPRSESHTRRSTHECQHACIRGSSYVQQISLLASPCLKHVCALHVKDSHRVMCIAVGRSLSAVHPLSSAAAVWPRCHLASRQCGQPCRAAPSAAASSICADAAC